MNLRNVPVFLSKQIQGQGRKISYKNIHGVFTENQRIIDKCFELSNNNDPKDIDFYIFPDQKILNPPPKQKNSEKSILFNISDNQLTSDEKSEIRDEYREILVRILHSNYSSIEDDKKKCLDLIKTQYGRE